MRIKLLLLILSLGLILSFAACNKAEHPTAKAETAETTEQSAVEGESTEAPASEHPTEHPK